MDVIIIAAVAKNGVIGKNNGMPWHLPEDFRHFKETTKGHAVIMGRKTFESIGKPLPDRVNIVLSRKMVQPEEKEYFVSPSMELALNLCKREGIEKAFIIGGARVYAEALEKGYATRMILTEVKSEYEGDTLFPEWSREDWNEVSREEHEEFDFVTYESA